MNGFLLIDVCFVDVNIGFKVSNTSCCKVDAKLGGLCLPNSKLCDNRGDYVFWDAFHPSDAANVVLAQGFFNTMFGNSPSPAPMPSHKQILTQPWFPSFVCLGGIVTSYQRRHYFYSWKMICISKFQIFILYWILYNQDLGQRQLIFNDLIMYIN